MIATRYFLFIHLHKTGGQFVNRLLLTEFPDATRIGYHLPRCEAPAYFRNLPAIGFTRNPWDWYVSWYSFNLNQPTRNPIFRILSNSGQNDFKTTITNMLTLGDADHVDMLRAIVAMLPTTRDNTTNSGLTKAIFSTLSGNQYGYFTWLFNYMFACNDNFDNMFIGRMEELRRILPQTLELLCPGAMSKAFRDKLEHGERINTSTRQHYRSYYDSDLRYLVEARDRLLIEQYRYLF